MKSKETGTDPFIFDKEYKMSILKQTYMGADYFDMISSTGEVNSVQSGAANQK